MRLFSTFFVITILVVTSLGIAQAEDIVFPTHPNVVDIKQAPYGAKGDGVSDDFEAIQRAINENVGQHRVLYFPNGTYLVSSTLKWPKSYAGHDNWGFSYLCGQSREKCIIRLKDSTFTDADQPQPIMWCGGFGSADWFHNYVENLTFDIGKNNLGAIALQFYSNNSGAVRNCRFLDDSDVGHTGLDLGHSDMNGPLLVSHCDVIGFRRGITTSHAVNGQVFEHIRMKGQKEIAFVNEGQSVSIRSFISDNEVPAIMTYGSLCLLEANLIGRGDAKTKPAMVNFNGGHIFLRDIKTNGYGRALGDVSQTPDSAAAFRVTGEDKLGSQGPDITEYYSHISTSPFPSFHSTLRLNVKEAPEIPRDAPASWAVVDDFGADPTGVADSASAIQQAIDSGATTVFLPGSYKLEKTVVVRGKVRRLVGLGGQINYGRGLEPDFRLVDGESPVVLIEHLAHVDGGVEVHTNRTLVVRSVSDCDFSITDKTAGANWFFEDVVTHELTIKEQKLWARQLNIENQGTHLINDRSDLWILGYKTERGGTLLDTRSGGRSEILGGFSYTTTAGKLAPMFINRDSSVSAFFSEVCFNGDPFESLIQEIRSGQSRNLDGVQEKTFLYLGVPKFAK